MTATFPAMTDEGPPLELLLRRLAETPPDFLSAGVRPMAVVHDLLRRHGATEIDPRLERLGQASSPDDANRIQLLLVLSWLYADDWFAAGRDPGALLGAMAAASSELAALVPAAGTIADPDRREELARLALAHLSLRPAGESEALARDRLTTLSTAERARVIASSRAAEERARAIREALARKAAQEAADKWTRE